MTGADLQWGEENVPVLALNESVDRRLMPPGSLTEVVNVDYSTHDGSVCKRPGTHLAMNSTATANANRLVVHKPKNQLLVADLVGDGTTAPALYAAIDAPADGDTSLAERHVGNASNVLVRRQPIATDLESSIIADCAYVATASLDFGFMVYGMVYVQSHNWVVKIAQVPKQGSAYEPGNTVVETLIPYEREDGSALTVRCAPAQDRYVLVMAAMDAGIGSINLNAVVVDCEAPGGPTVSAVINVVNGVFGFASEFSACGGDACESTYDLDVGAGVPNWIVAYTTGANVIVRRLYSTALTVSWTTTLTTDPQVRALTCYEYSGTTWLSWWTIGAGINPAGWRYGAIDTATGTTTLPETGWCSVEVGTADILAEGWMAGICFHEVAGQVVLFHSQNYDQVLSTVAGFDERAITRWRVVDTTGIVSALYQKRGPWLLSKPWKDRANGFYMAWCGYDNVSHRPSQFGSGATVFSAQYDMTAVLMRFAEPPVDAPTYASSTAPKAQAIATTAGYTLAEPTSMQFAVSPYHPPRYAAIPRSVTHGTVDSGGSDVELLGRRCCINVRYIPNELQSGPWDTVVRDTESEDFTPGYGRYQSALFGQSTYLAGGALMQWDGDRHHENNYISQPTIGITHVTTGDTWDVSWAQQDIHFQAVWETIGEGGERTRSATSALATFTLGGDIASGTAPTDTITLYLEPNTVTARTYGSNQQTPAPRTIVTVYASQAPAGTDLHRIVWYESTQPSQYVSDPDYLQPIGLTFQGISTPAGSSEAKELIYNDSGELDNDPPYDGCSTLAVHKDRLWVGGGAESDVLWYSKERADGRPAEFALGQQVRLAGQEVVALASLDDALVVLCRNGVYSLYGDGPNATGDPASGIFQIVPLSTSVGCVSPAVAVTPKGVIFQSDSGMMLVTRGRTIEAMPHVNQTTTIQPVKAATVVPEFSQARFVLGTSAALVDQPTNADVLVYDWDADRWSTWRYVLNNHALEAPEGLVVDVAVTTNGRTYMLTDDGRVLREDAALGGDCYGTVGVGSYAFHEKLKFSWLDFGRPNGYKRVRHWLALMEPKTWADYSSDPESFPFGIKASFDFNHAESGTTVEKFWTNYELGQTAAWDGITKVRAHIGKKQPAVRVTLEECEPTRKVTGSDTAASVVVGSNTTLRLIIAAGALSFTAFTVTGGTRTKAQIAADLNRAFMSEGWGPYVQAEVDGSNQLVLRTLGRESDAGLGSYLRVDSVANGSTLNSVVGFAAGATTGAWTVAAAAQSGFVIQGQTFEVGQAPGLRRTAATQSK